MRPLFHDKAPAPQPHWTFLPAAPPAPNAKCCTCWDHSNTQVPPRDSHSESASHSAPPIPISLPRSESAARKTAESYPHSQTPESALHSSEHTPPSNRELPTA